MGDPLPSVPDRFTPPSLHDPLPRRKDAFEQFDPDQTIDPTNDGVSGLWFPDVNKMYISPRRSHHNDQLRLLNDTGQLDGLGSEFVPWVWDLIYLRDEPPRAELDFPRSAGGAFQYVSRNDIPQTYVRSGDTISISDVYAVVWTCRRLSVPEESSTDVAYLPPDSPYEPGTTRALEFGVVRSDDRQIGDWYRELRFVDMLPTPAFERSVNISPPD